MLKHLISILLKNDMSFLGISRSAIKKAGHKKERKKIALIQKSKQKNLNLIKYLTICQSS